MNNLVKKQKNGTILAWTAKLMGLAIVLNIASCSWNKDNKEALEIELTAGETAQKINIASGTTSGSTNTLLTVKLKEGTEELDLEKVKLIAEKTAVYKAKDATGAEDGNKDHIVLEYKKSDLNGRSLKDLTGEGKLKKGKDVKVEFNVTLNKISETASAKVKFYLEQDGKEIKDAAVTVTYIMIQQP